jgi:hypothetical protein
VAEWAAVAWVAEEAMPAVAAKPATKVFSEARTTGSPGLRAPRWPPYAAIKERGALLRHGDLALRPFASGAMASIRFARFGKGTNTPGFCALAN